MTGRAPPSLAGVGLLGLMARSTACATGWQPGPMTEPDLDIPLSRTDASRAVEDIGWRYMLGRLNASVPVASLAQASQVAAAVVEAAGVEGDSHLRLDLRSDRVEVSVQTRELNVVTKRDSQLARRVAGAFDRLGLDPAGATSAETPRPVQMLEMAIDALDIAAIRPFWKAAMAYVDEAGTSGPEAGIVDPAGQLPGIWFQQMDAPRPQRNRVHFDITVAHDEAEARVRAALDAGGRLVDDSFARSFWVLADTEGNEVCVCTWADRDEREQ
jgi:4a-hydroxytetrahydrobiopterin dehydratase